MTLRDVGEGDALLLVGEEPPRVRVLKGFRLIRDEVERAIDSSLGLEEEGVARIFTGATVELLPGRRFRFAPPATAGMDKDLFPLEGTYYDGDDKLKLRAAKSAHSSATVSLDGFIHKVATDPLLDVVYTAVSSSLPRVARVVQRLRPARCGAGVSGPPREEFGGIPIPSFFKVVFDGEADGHRFEALPGVLMFQPDASGAAGAVSLSLLNEAPEQIGSVFWVTPVGQALASGEFAEMITEFSVEGGRLRLVLHSDEPRLTLPAPTWTTTQRHQLLQGLPGLAIMLDATLMLAVEGKRVSGELRMKGVTGYAVPLEVAEGGIAAADQSSTYTARFIGQEDDGSGHEAPAGLSAPVGGVAHAREVQTAAVAPHADSVFTVSLRGTTESGPFGPLPGRLFISPTSERDANPYSVTLITNTGAGNGKLYWASTPVGVDASARPECRVHVSGDDFRVTYDPSNQTPTTAWYTLAPSADGGEFFALALVQEGDFTFTIQRNALSGEIHASGVYGLGFGEMRPSTFDAEVKGQRERSRLIEGLREATADVSLSGEWVSGEDDFGRIALRVEGAAVVGEFEGRGGGHLEGEAEGSRVDFTWQAEAGQAGWGFFRMLGSGRELAGLWGRGGECGGREFIAQRQFAALTPQSVPSGEALGLKHLGMDLLEAGKFEQAAEVLEKALSLYQKERHRQPDMNFRQSELLNESSVLSRLIRCYFYLGDYDRMLARLDGALEVQSLLAPSESLKMTFKSRVAELQKALASTSTLVETVQGEFEKALANAGRADPALEETTSRQRRAELDDASAFLASHLRDLLAGFACASTELAQMAEQVESGQLIAVGALARLRVYVQEQRAQLLNEAEEIMAHDDALFRERAELRRLVREYLRGLRVTERADAARLNLGELSALEESIKHEMHERAQLTRVERALLITELTLVPVIFPLAFQLGLEGEFIERLAAESSYEHQTSGARESALAIADALESWRARLVTDLEKVTALERGQPFFRRLVKFLVETGGTKEALLVSERARARALADLLAARERPGAGGAQPHLEGHGYHNPFTAAPATFESILQAARLQRSTIIEYFVAGRELFIWVIDPDGSVTLRRRDCSDCEHTLEEMAVSARVSLGVRGRNLTVAEAPVRADAATHFGHLYQILIEPVEDLLPADDEQLIFIPHGPLFFVPFAALRASGQNSAYLIERHPILTAPSIQILNSIGVRPRGERVRGDALVVGNPLMPAVKIDRAQPAEQLPPLPFAEHEAKEVSRLLGTDALTGESATKEAVVGSMSDKRFIHLATHGLLDDLEGLGLPGAIALAPSAAGDGLLTAREIMDLQLDAELVVLSACNTGRGRVTGDGVVGLSRSFIHAGATCLLVSLWTVDDASTSRLIANFYRNLAHTPGKAEALRQAMLTMMRLEEKSPVHWAAFVLVGDGRAGSAPGQE